jgi:hypothetical protein
MFVLIFSAVMAYYVGLPWERLPQKYASKIQGQSQKAD